MDVITPTATCPHCGLALEGWPSVIAVAPPPAPRPEPAAVIEAAPPIEPARPPVPAAVTAPVPLDEAPAELAPPPAVPEFVAVVTHVAPEPEVPEALAAVERGDAHEDPWITMPPPPVRAAAPAARVIDTGRGWSIRGGAPSPIAPLVASLPVALPRPAPERAARTTRLAITGVTAIVIAATLAVVAGGAIGNLTKTPPHLAAPSAIGSLTRVTTPTSQALLAGIQSQVRAVSTTDAIAAVYGTGATPKLVFIAYGGAAAQTPDQLVAAVNASATPFTQTPKVSTVGGQSYVCGRVGTAAKPSVLCTWTDAHGAAFIDAIDSTDLTAALSMAAAARASSEG